MWNQRLQEALQRLRQQDPLELGAAGDSAWQATLLQERRYSRIFVVRPLDPVAGELMRGRLETEAIVLKLYHAVQADRRQAEFDDLHRVRQLCGPDLQGSVVRPVAAFADLGVVMTHFAQGQPAAQLVQQACRNGASADQMAESAALCTRAGTWLSSFQLGIPQLGDQLSPHLATADDFVDYVSARLAHMQRAPFRLSAAALVRTRRALRRALEDSQILQPVTWSHSDFGPHNLLGDATQVTVLDFELMPQHPWFDAAYFIESLAGFSGPRYSSTNVARLQRVFLSGYGLSGHEPLFLALRIRHLACTAASLRAQRTRLPIRNWADHWILRRRLARLVEQLQAAPHSSALQPQLA